MRKKLSNEQIVKLASMVANDLGMKALDENALIKGLRKNPIMPTIIRDGHAQLWVDRYYIAYSLEDEKVVHYVYITPEHAKEELLDLAKRILKCAKSEEADMLRDIMRQLKNALRTERTFYIKSKYRRMMESTSILAI